MLLAKGKKTVAWIFRRAKAILLTDIEIIKISIKVKRKEKEGFLSTYYLRGLAQVAMVDQQL